ncbi:MAG: transposase [Candidatus Omnitrophica bacterium]|nr:transposase [Candidatus Omnitrophota bacterium]MBU1922855.1 transposase [Candidatus Omnitrophota bacterium]
MILKEFKKLSDQNAILECNIHYLRSIPGIGFIIAITILASIGDIEELHGLKKWLPLWD